MKKAKEKNLRILPIDSEHSAIFQSLMASGGSSIERILLTASGGPFFGYSYEKLKTVTKAQALKHPNWNMGQKITTDSATLMNKGLELIEAVWLFGVTPEKVEVNVHRQSILHSAVEFEDGFGHRSDGRTRYENTDTVCADLSRKVTVTGKKAIAF